MEYILPVLMPEGYSFKQSNFKEKLKSFLDERAGLFIPFETWMNNNDRNKTLKHRRETRGEVSYITVNQECAIPGTYIKKYEMDEYQNIYVVVEAPEDSGFSSSGVFRPRMLISNKTLKQKGYVHIERVCALDYIMGRRKDAS